MFIKGEWESNTKANADAYVPRSSDQYAGLMARLIPMHVSPDASKKIILVIRFWLEKTFRLNASPAHYITKCIAI